MQFCVKIECLQCVKDIWTSNLCFCRRTKPIHSTFSNARFAKFYYYGCRNENARAANLCVGEDVCNMYTDLMSCGVNLRVYWGKVHKTNLLFRKLQKCCSIDLNEVCEKFFSNTLNHTKQRSNVSLLFTQISKVAEGLF